MKGPCVYLYQKCCALIVWQIATKFDSSWAWGPSRIFFPRTVERIVLMFFSLKTILLVGLLLECSGLARKIDTTKQSRHITRILLLPWKLASKRTEISTRRCPQESHSPHYISALLVTATCLRLVLAMRQCALRQAMFQKFRSRSLVNVHGSVESLHIHYMQ